MKMFGELLAEPDLTEGERKEYCDILNQSLDKLTFLTESMIRISRLESGIIQLKPLKTDLNEMKQSGIAPMIHGFLISLLVVIVSFVVQSFLGIV